MRVGSRAIIHHLEKYHFVQSILCKNAISYCFSCNFAKFCRFWMVCNVFDLAPTLWMLWWKLQQNTQAYHVCIKYLARAICKLLCFRCIYWSKLMNLCCFVSILLFFCCSSLFFFACTHINIVMPVLQCTIFGLYH